MKNSQELSDLKCQWLNDPCWDIEDTEGFEAHRVELLAFREQQEVKWSNERVSRVQAKAEQLGVPGNTALANYVLALEQRLSALEAKLNN